jgi:hypothetical protein
VDAELVELERLVLMFAGTAACADDPAFILSTLLDEPFFELVFVLDPVAAPMTMSTTSTPTTPATTHLSRWDRRGGGPAGDGGDAPRSDVGVGSRGLRASRQSPCRRSVISQAPNLILRIDERRPSRAA